MQPTRFAAWNAERRTIGTDAINAANILTMTMAFQTEEFAKHVTRKSSLHGLRGTREKYQPHLRLALQVLRHVHVLVAFGLGSLCELVLGTVRQ